MKRNEEHADEGSQRDHQKRDSYRPQCLGLRLKRVDFMATSRTIVTADRKVFDLPPELLFLQHLPTLAPYLAIVINLTSVELVLDLL